MSTFRGSVIKSIVLLFVLPILIRADSVAAEDADVPGFSGLGKGSTLSYAVSGLLELRGQPIARLVVERLALEPDEMLANTDDPQLIAVESGNLAMSDDLGLSAGLAEGAQLFADANAYPEISANQPTTLLRARLTNPTPDLVIEDASCSLKSPTVFNLDGLTIVNDSATDQSFTIGEIGLHAVISAGEMTIVPIALAPEGTWEASCGQTDDGEAIETLALEVRDGHQPHDATIFFDKEIALIPAESATFYMAEIALAADGSLGKQTFGGPTVIAASDQPFWVKRPRRLTSSIPESGSALLPPGTQATIENAGKNATSALVIGVVPAAADSANTSGQPDGTTAKEGPDSRPVTRDEQETAFDTAARRS